MIERIANLSLTVIIALVAGRLCREIGLPAPYLLGSLFGVWAAGAAFPFVRVRVGVPRWVHVPVTLGLGVLIGGMFVPGVVDEMMRWSYSVVVLMITTVVVTTVGFFYFFRIRGYDRKLALLCCLPGGQAEILAISRDMVEKDYVVALFHLVRVSVIFTATPLLLTVVEGKEAIAESDAVLQSLPGIMTVSPLVLGQFLLVGGLGYVVARLVRMPIPHMLGPLLFSAALHMMGVIQIPRLGEFVLLAQIVIGGAVGAKLAKVSFVELSGYLKDALINTFIIVTLYSLAGVMLGLYLDLPLMDAVFAFIPGGYYRITLLALLFGLDLGFITFHHTLRVLMIYLVLPLIGLKK